MTIDTRELIEAVSVLAEDHNIRVTVKSSLRASATVAGTSFVGAMLLGPIGILVGAFTGGVLGYSMARGQFKSVAVIIRDELTEEQANRLCFHIHEAFKDFGPEDIALLLPLLAADIQLQKVIIAKVVQFVTQELQMQIID